MRSSLILVVTALSVLVVSRAFAQSALEQAESEVRDATAAGPELIADPPAEPIQPRSAGAGPGYLGIKAENGPVEGVRVVEVTTGSPADLGGLRPNDLIIAVQGKPLDSVEDFARLLKGKSAGTAVTFDLLRGNERKAVGVVLLSKPGASSVTPQMRLGPTPPAPGNAEAGQTPTSSLAEAERAAPLGMRVEMMTDAARQERNLPLGTGVLVTRITPDSAAEQAGVTTGSVLMAIDDQPIATPDDAAAILRNARAGLPVTFSINEAGQPVERTILPLAMRGAESRPKTTALPTSLPTALPTSAQSAPRPVPAPPAPEPGSRNGRPLATINNEIDDARSHIRKLEGALMGLEKRLEKLQQDADRERQDLQETMEALRKANAKTQTRVVPIDP